MPESIYTTHYNFYSKENSAKQATEWKRNWSDKENKKDIFTLISFQGTQFDLQGIQFDR